MNFIDVTSGNPSIPELVNPQGFEKFRIVVVVYGLTCVIAIALRWKFHNKVSYRILRSARSDLTLTHFSRYAFNVHHHRLHRDVRVILLQLVLNQLIVERKKEIPSRSGECPRSISAKRK